MRFTNLIPNSQFGGGFQPPVSDNVFIDGADTAPLINMERMISNVIGILTVGAGIFFIVYFLLAAISMITSAGDSGKMNKAKDQMINGILGLIVVVATYAIVGLLGTIIGLDILNPAAQLDALRPGGGTP